MVLETAYDIVKAGIEDPEFFQLLPLFQDNVGPCLLYTSFLGIQNENDTDMMFDLACLA